MPGDGTSPKSELPRSRGAAQPRGASGSGFGYGPELLDEMTTTKVVHLGVAPAPRS